VDELGVRSTAAEGIRAQAERLWPAVLRSVRAAESLTHSGPDSVRRHTFAAVDEYGRELTVRLDSVPLPDGRQVRVFANTTSDNHVIQLSDQLTPDQVGPALAWGAADLMSVRRRADAGIPPVRRDLLDGTVVGLDADPLQASLSEHDYARIGRLDWLGSQATDATLDDAVRRTARDALSAELDELGLRAITDDQARARAYRLLMVEPRVRWATVRAIRELSVPIEQLAPEDAAALQAHRETLREAVQPTGPPVTASIERSQLKAAAEQAAEARDHQSARTLESLRREQLPKMRLMIGGGAALAGRDPEVLLVDGRGRWHVDPIPGIVQSADQVRHLYDSGLGDPHQFAGPRDRVPLTAITLWEDTAAVRGPVVDGMALLDVDPSGRLVADIRPLDGSGPVWVEVDGTPVVATGVPPEIVPGASRWMPTMPEALTALDGCLADLRTPGAAQARELLRGLRDVPGSAATALDAVGSVPEFRQLRDNLRIAGIPGAPLEEAMTTLEATAAWDRARAEAPGRVLIGDEVGDGEYDAGAGRRWLIAGIGGGAIANAEIILAGNPDAEVVMVGTEAPWVLHNDAQYTALRQRHDKAVNPDATGRLTTIPGRRLGPVATAQGYDGRTVVRMLDDQGRLLTDESGQPLEGDAYVGCLGRVARLPRVLDNLQRWADHVRGELDFSEDRQYLGYQVTFQKGDASISVDVTGAASRLLPADLFDARTAAVVNELGLVEAPPESGNVAAGFMATALQAQHRAHHRAQPSRAQASRALE
jgi:hypothetical protein